jgi:3-phenylpropionate/trans-cinnamate dioxygenase ferredoxin reductase component
MASETVIIGAGHAGVQAAASLREEGYDGAIRLVDAQRALPYQRPPLSKAFMKGETSAENIVLRGEAFYGEHRIDLLLGERAERIDSGSSKLWLGSGKKLAYDHLVIATGARARPLSAPGADLENIFILRDMADALNIKAAMAAVERIAVVGGGFIGLEFAAVAAASGKKVTVVEAMSRVMARAVSEPVSLAFQRKHASLGADLRLGVGVAGLAGAGGKVSGVMLSDGSTIPCDMAVVGIGVLAEDGLAARAGLALANGVTANGEMRTSDPAIFAIGDVNNHHNPFFGGALRLESVQNAVDQAKTAAKAIAGRPAEYRSTPWFWSDQADLKLLIAGVAPKLDRIVLRGDPESAAFSAFGYADGRLRVVESVNRPADHMVARRMIGEGRGPTPAEAADPAFDLKAFAMAGARP